MKAHRAVDSIPWSPHPTAKGVKIKPMISKREHGLDTTCVLVQIPSGEEIPEHIHETQDDIVYPLKGKGLMWVDGNGDFSLEPGMIVRVPKGTKHKIFSVSEDLLLFDVFSPATF